MPSNHLRLNDEPYVEPATTADVQHAVSAWLSAHPEIVSSWNFSDLVLGEARDWPPLGSMTLRRDAPPHRRGDGTRPSEFPRMLRNVDKERLAWC